MTPDAAIQGLKQLFSACGSDPVWNGPGSVTVRVAAEGGVAFSLLRELEEQQVFVTIADAKQQRDYIEGTDGAVNPGTQLHVNHANQVERLVLVEDVGMILKLATAHQREPASYVIWKPQEQPIFHLQSESTGNLPESLRSYHAAISLWQLLRKFAHHQDASTDSLWFFGIRKTEIEPGFKEEHLKGAVDASEVVQFMAGTDAHEVRKEILSSRISHHLQNQEASQRFGFLLGTIRVFARGLREALAIYLCEHSPEKLAEEASKAALDFTEKLEKIVSGLEAKSLTVPVAILLAYKEVKVSEVALFHNLIILISVGLYFAAMAWVWYTQAPLLDLLYKSMTEKEAELRKKGLEASNPILAETFQTLKNRALRSEKFAGVMLLCSFIPVIAVFVRWAPTWCVF